MTKLPDTAALLNEEGIWSIPDGTRISCWLPYAQRQVAAMAELKLGWNGDAEPPAAAARDHALQCLAALHAASLSPKAIAPSWVGGVTVALAANGRAVDFEFLNSGRAFVIHSGCHPGPDIRQFRLERMAAAAMRAKSFLEGNADWEMLAV